MANPQYAILRFAKYKGPEISRIEAHNERTKETYASNPDIDHTRSHLNFSSLSHRGRESGNGANANKGTGGNRTG